MRQFDACHNANIDSAEHIPYFLILQNDLLDHTPTCVVAPLVVVGKFEPIEKLSPAFVIEKRNVIMLTVQLAGINRRAIGQTVTNLQSRRDEIISALDLLFTGY